MTDELVNIIYFLTKQNVQKDMQKEIMKYYQSKKKYRLLILDYYESYDASCKNESYLYHEFIPYGPIEQIDLINLFKFIHDESKEKDSDVKVVSYNKKYIKFARGNYYFHQSTQNILKYIIRDGVVLLSDNASKALSNNKLLMCSLKTIEI